MAGIRRAVLIVLIGLAVPVLWNEPASAAPLLTVTPATGLVDGQTVTVEGSGFGASKEVGYCQGIDVGTPPVDARQCRDGQYVAVVTSPDGDFSVEIVVHSAIFTPGTGRVVNCSVEPCSIGAAEVFNIAATASFAPLSFVPGGGQPDGLIKRRSDGQITGNGVYGIAGASGQKRYHRVEPGGRWAYALKVENDGFEADEITVSAAAPASFVTVRYFVGWYDVTASVQGEGFTYRSMAPGAIESLAVQFNVDPDAPAIPGRDVFVKFTSGATGSSDTIVVGVVVPPV